VAERREHLGVNYSISVTDLGVWYYKVLPRPMRIGQHRPRAAPTQGYNTRTEVIAAAEKAIEDWIRGESSDPDAIRCKNRRRKEQVPPSSVT
jgi:hypothetical protein